ncbi:MAG: acyltransferase family protein [Oscillospiraceae bacterium]
MVKSDRIEWVDVAKGIAILLVVLGHTLSWSDANEKIYRDIIYSFHMPLFFILSAVASKEIKDSKELVSKIEKSFVRLMVPVIGYVFISAILEIIFMHDSLDVSSYLAKRINAIVYANGVSVHVLDGVIPSIGVVWFMVTLFLAKNLFNYICLKLVTPMKIFVATMICGVGGMLIGYIQWLPFTLDIVFQVMPFFYFGSKLKDIKTKKHIVVKMIIMGAAWITIFMIYHRFTNSYYDLSWRWHPLYPLSDIGAVCGSMFFICISVLLEKYKIVSPLKYLGRNTYVFYWIHVFDYMWVDAWALTDNVLIKYILRISVDIALFCMIQYFGRFLKNNYSYLKNSNGDN